MTTVYTNPPTTQSSALDDARVHLNVAHDSGDWHTVESSLQMASAAALVSIAETLAALLPATQAIAKVLTDVHSTEYGALAVLDAAHEEKQIVTSVPPRADEDAGKGATSAQTTTDELSRTKAKLDRLIFAVDELFIIDNLKRFGDLNLTELWNAFTEAQRP